MENIKFIINRSEITAGTRGASLGPDALKVVAWKQGSTIFGKYPIEEIKDANHYLNRPIIHQYAKRIEGLTFIYDQVAQAIKYSLSHSQFPIVLSGDHGSAGGTIAGIKAMYPEKRLGVIWVDAHGDLHTPYTTPSGNMHGMPLSTALGEDNLEVQRNFIPEETKSLWEKLKNTGFPGAKVRPEDLIFVGVRDVEPEEVALMERLNIRNFPVDEVRRKGAGIVATEIGQLLENCDLIYISFDVDSMDPEETSHGTGTPVPNGLSVAETKELLTKLVDTPKLACFELVEINPCLDEKVNKMAETAFEILEEVIAVIATT
ncbi:arginase [Crocinitomicaceae bacterium CZZ-1]|uniref:Arginase n=1 Tax=Taishania pollutisoli TaxID=2766479 RepID=A0A8J6TU12_9FLAO|nr:arginase [Taishania pollutisoli]MBC9813749.1 arginase [Taishania pollutisoli]MBX2950739.1 arginase [Crocinitomicaceae bacterium]NGF77262.1 arginase [Fluviicola sp. SGL-29]